MRILFYLFLLFSSQASASSNIDCQTEYRKRLQTDLDLNYQEFDQTEGQGMRALAYAGCAKEAADLIVAYIKKTMLNRSRCFGMWHNSVPVRAIMSRQYTMRD